MADRGKALPTSQVAKRTGARIQRSVEREGASIERKEENGREREDDDDDECEGEEEAHSAEEECEYEAEEAAEPSTPSTSDVSGLTEYIPYTNLYGAPANKDSMPEQHRNISKATTTTSRRARARS